ncbi:diacylglycerol/lipid kinase family protein [Aerococcus kribbianus]|uniref:Diacylglycerol kinase family lipid kinase n=1 Tax=Aerococcus kribbianus TaxID=2999064 RepID=A0A9X3JEE9_9LACT|nr:MULTISPECIES: diacylglycerol kinase family protein [unclassified Aerococcus]MCZ0717034.1 diacylglycerol kinase family lipid kinase [Aerococcus sp. YH-aer221]MCZ0725322.1 diacylglycerol kinase family lipid kinase [Aerococcus sp. YH-aer222]
MSGCLLVINPSSGKENKDGLSEKISAMLSKHFDRIELRYTEKAGDAEAFVDLAKDLNMDTYFVVGGDGTVNEAINGLAKMENPLKFGFLPMGTVNDLARALGIPLKLEDALSALEHITWQPLDVGQINDQYFMNVVALGEIPYAVNHTSSEEKSKFGFFAYLKDGFNALINDEGQTYHIKLDGEELDAITTEIILVALTNSVGSVEQMVADARVDDGLLHLLVLKDTNALEIGQEALQNLFDGNVSQANNVSYYKGQHIEITSDDKSDDIESNVDGDPGPTLPLELSILPSKLKVMVPKA